MSDAEAIAGRRQTFLDAFHAEDIDTMTDFVTENHRAMPPNMPPNLGRAAAQDFWRQGFSQAKTTFSIDSNDVTIFGDTAIDVFSWDMRITPHGSEDALEDNGGCVWIWQKGDDGTWRVETAIWNSSRAEPGVWSGG